MKEQMGIQLNENVQENNIEEALRLRLELLQTLETGDFPNRQHIDTCKGIIFLLPPKDTNESADRSARFSKGVKKILMNKFKGCIACGGGVEGGDR